MANHRRDRSRAASAPSPGGQVPPSPRPHVQGEFPGQFPAPNSVNGFRSPWRASPRTSALSPMPKIRVNDGDWFPRRDRITNRTFSGHFGHTAPGRGHRKSRLCGAPRHPSSPPQSASQKSHGRARPPASVLRAATKTVAAIVALARNHQHRSAKPRWGHRRSSKIGDRPRPAWRISEYDSMPYFS